MGTPRLPETRREMAAYIDHTVLAPDASSLAIAKLCETAKNEHTASVCVSPNRVALAARYLEGSDVPVCTVVGFPSGAHSAEAKAFEAAQAVADGATEIDMVVNLGAVADGDWDTVNNEMAQVRAATDGYVLKTILESALWDEATLVKLCEIAVANDVDIVKTSTGFNPAGGASLEAVSTMSKTVTGRAGVKASGGIRDTETALAMIGAGATRIGDRGHRFWHFRQLAIVSM